MPALIRIADPSPCPARARSGWIFCHECSKGRAVVAAYGSEPVRVCSSCEQTTQGRESQDQRKEAFYSKHGEMLRAGAVFMKHGRKGMPHRRQVKLNAALSHICWRDAEGGDAEEWRDMPLDSVVSLMEGKTTPVFKRTLSGKAAKDDLCFSLIGKERTLDLEAETPGVRETWVVALKEAAWAAKYVSDAKQREDMARKRLEREAAAQREQEEQDLRSKLEQRKAERRAKAEAKVREKLGT